MDDKLFAWIEKREPLISPKSEDFWAYEDAIEKAAATIEGLQSWVSEAVFEMLRYNLVLHFIIVTDYVDDDGNPNPLYAKYNISEASKGIVSSASDESSSASLHITSAMNELDYFGMNLTMTPYGKEAYSILCQINAMPVLL